MFLSQLIPNPRSREVRQDLSKVYELHRTLLRAFPDDRDGGPGRLLFRLDWNRTGTAAQVLIQSEKAPDWTKLSPSYCLEIGCKSIDDLKFSPHQRLTFRLRANPTRRVGKSADARWAGKRVGLMQEADQQEWLQRKATEGGFRLLSVTLRREEDTQAFKAQQAMKFLAVRFEGILRVTDPVLFLKTLAQGIGPGKAFGFGLLSVAAVEG